MAKVQIQYLCAECGEKTLKWQGQCPACGAWNTLTESLPAATDRLGYAGDSRARPLAEVGPSQGTRRSSGIGELDRVLGGGMVPGGVVLIGGDPGIGKSTLLLQAAGLAGDVLYVSGEESLEQIGLRSQRLQVDPAGITVLAETRVERIIELVNQIRPALLIIDSIQTVYSETHQSLPGSVTQLRESTARLVRMAKTTNVGVFLVGHVTKEGHIAGPRVLEHMVDVVLYFENEVGSRYRILRAAKNRFGAVNELGIFVMTGQGIREVRNPSAIFLSRQGEPVPGSVVTVCHEGSRPLLIEVQALADEAGTGGTVRRLAVGLDQNRLAMLLAALHRHGGVATRNHDVFINVVGGVRITETSGDLAALAAIVSSLTGAVVSQGTVIFGEVGLAGEIRPVAWGEERLGEAAKLGFRRAVIPKANLPRRPPRGLETIGVENLRAGLEAAGFSG